MSECKQAFSKGYRPYGTTEVFTIIKVFNTNPVTHQLEVGLNNSILRCFYGKEIAKINFPDAFLIFYVFLK